MCLGCNITDHSKLSPGGNLVVSLAGLLATQVAALSALLLMRVAPHGTFRRRLLAAVSLGFAFLDVPVQVIQGLLYDIAQHTWPTNVDLLDAMLLVSDATGAPYWLLKGILAIAATGYLYAIAQGYRNARPVGRALQARGTT